MPKRPKVTCPSCGQRFADSALERHRGSAKCFEQYSRGRLQDELVVPPGQAVIPQYHEREVHAVCKLAGVMPEDALIKLTPVWWWATDEPEFRWVGPAWLAPTARALGELRYARSASVYKTRQMDAVVVLQEGTPDDYEALAVEINLRAVSEVRGLVVTQSREVLQILHEWAIRLAQRV